MRRRRWKSVTLVPSRPRWRVRFESDGEEDEDIILLIGAAIERRPPECPPSDN
jgi:hypothetical protein